MELGLSFLFCVGFRDIELGSLGLSGKYLTH